MSPETIMTLANQMFGWDIDFALDIRDGDEFGVLYEQKYQDGEYVNDGRVLAAEFVNQGKMHRAVWFAVAGRPGARVISRRTARACARRSCVRRSISRASVPSSTRAASTRSAASSARTRAWITPRRRARRSGPQAKAASSSPAARAVTATS